MNQSNLEQLTQKIIKAVPSIVELKPGCLIKINHPERPEFTHLIKITALSSGGGAIYGYGDGHHEMKYNAKDLVEILGRPILLEDVLIALGKDYDLDIKIDIDNEKQITIKKMKDDVFDGQSYPKERINWLLNTPLHLQSEETISEINKLIK